jgi:uncharacterized protein involved in type VI secretion and phage assembly
MQQTAQVVVRGWDVKGKTVVQSQAQVASDLKQGGNPLQTEFAAARTKMKMVVTDEPAINTEAAKAMADAIAGDVLDEFVKAEGECVGTPLLRAGCTVKLTGLGKKFSGNYVVTSATHSYSPNEGYRVAFVVSGRHANTLAQLLDGPRSERDGAERPDRMKGVVVGVITNNNDPVGLGRVKVKWAWLGDQIESAWCRVASPMAGSGRGFYFIPEVNDEVLVAFEHGDPNVPYIVGVLWNTSDKPPKPNAQMVSGGKVNERMLRSRSGHDLIFCDEAGKEKITIVDKEKNSIVIDSVKKSLTITVKGECAIVSDGPCKVTAKQDIELKSTGQDVTIECTNFNVKAKAKCKLESKAQMDLESAMVNVKSTGPMAVDGKPVQINQSSLVVMP